MIVQFKAALLSLMVACSGLVQAQNETVVNEVEALVQVEQGYFDGKHWRKLWINPHELVEFDASEQSEEWLRARAPQAKSIMHDKRMRIWQLGKKEDLDGLKRDFKRSGSKRFSPVYHVSKSGGPRLVLAGNMIVRFKTDQTDEQIIRWVEKQGLVFVRAMSLPRTYLFAADSVTTVLFKANKIQKSGAVEYAIPEWWREAYKR